MRAALNFRAALATIKEDKSLSQMNINPPSIHYLVVIATMPL